MSWKTFLKAHWGGHRYQINVEPEMNEAALERYFAEQGRFRKGQIDMTRLRASVARQWSELRGRAAV